MFIFRQQNVGQSHNLKTSTKFFENVADIKYFFFKDCDKLELHKRILNSANAYCCYSDWLKIIN